MPRERICCVMWKVKSHMKRSSAAGRASKRSARRSPKRVTVVLDGSLFWGRFTSWTEKLCWSWADHRFISQAWSPRTPLALVKLQFWHCHCHSCETCLSDIVFSKSTGSRREISVVWPHRDLIETSSSPPIQGLSRKKCVCVARYVFFSIVSWTGYTWHVGSKRNALLIISFQRPPYLVLNLSPFILPITETRCKEKVALLGWSWLRRTKI